MACRDEECDELENWNPMADDYNDPEFNSYQRGPAKNLTKASINKDKNNFSIYIAGIPKDLNKEGLEYLFQKVGKIKSSYIHDQRADKDDKVGFVNFETQHEMEEAIRVYNGYEIGRFRLRISVALTKEEKEKRRADIAARLANDLDDYDMDEGRDSAKENKAPPRGRESRPLRENRSYHQNSSSQQNMFPRNRFESRGKGRGYSFGNDYPRPQRGNFSNPGYYPNEGPMMPMQQIGYGRGSPGCIPPQHMQQGFMDFAGAGPMNSMGGMMSQYGFGRGGGMPFQGGRGISPYGAVSPGFNRGYPGMGAGDFSQVGPVYSDMSDLDTSFGAYSDMPPPERFKSSFLEKAVNTKAMAIPRIEDRKPVAPRPQKKCCVCEALTRKYCKKCKMHYCSSECQRKDWDAHKSICAKLAENSRFEEQFDVEVGEGFIEKLQRKLELVDLSSNSDVGDELRRIAPYYLQEERKRVYLRDFPIQELHVGGEQEFVPVHVVYFEQPREFYIQYKHSANWRLYEKSKASMEQVYSRSTPTGYVPEDDEIVVVEDRKQWKRGAIHTVRTEKDKTVKYVVHLIDEGSKVEVQIDKLRRVNEELTKLPCQAVTCCLSDIQPMDGVFFGNEACNVTMNWLKANASVLECRVVGNFNNKRHVLLRANNVMLHTFLLEKKLVAVRELASRASQNNKRTECSPAQGPRQLDNARSPGEQNEKVLSDARERNTSKDSSKTQSDSSTKTRAPSGKFTVNSIESIYKSGSYFKGIPIECKSPTDFWVQVCCLDSKIEKYKELFADLNKRFYGVKNTTYRPEVGDFIIAPYDRESSRACVLDMRNDKFKVRFIDFGNTAVVPLEDVHPADFNSSYLYSVGVNCALAGVEEVKTEPWSQFAIDTFFSSFEKDVSVEFKVVKRSQDILEVEVHCEGRLLNEEFVRRCKNGPSPDRPLGKGAKKSTPKRNSQQKTGKQKKGSSPKNSQTAKGSPPRKESPTATQSKPAAVQQPKPRAQAIKPTIPARRMELGEPFQALPVVVISAEEFYVQPMAAAEEYGALCDAMEEYYSQHASPVSAAVGELVVAPFLGQFYRGRVENVDTGTGNVVVHFLDFGNKDPVEKDKIFAIQPEFMATPLIALSCRLANAPNGWSCGDNAIATIKELIPENTEIVTTVVEYVGDGAVVDFQTGSTTVSAIMTEAGFAKEASAKNAVGPTASPVSVPVPSRPAPERIPVASRRQASPNLKYVVERLAIGEEYQGLVTHCVSPAEIYVQTVLADIVQDFVDMSGPLVAKYSALGPNTTFRPSLGELVATTFAGDWCRAQVLTVSGNQCTLYFIDYGNEEAVLIENVYNLDAEFLTCVVPVVQCRVAGINGTANGSWSGSDIAAFGEMVLNNAIYIIEVVAIEGGVVDVDIFDCERTRNFRSELLMGGHAVEAGCPVVVSAPAEPAPAVPVPAEPTPAMPAPAKPASAASAASPPRVDEEPTCIRTLPTLLDKVKVGENYVVAPLNLESADPFYAVFLQIVDGKAITEMRQEFNIVYNKRKMKPNFRPIAGDIVAARWSVDQEWQRSRVISVDERKGVFFMFHVDLGHSSHVTLPNIRPIDKKYCLLPELVIPCRLENLQAEQQERAVQHMSYCTNEEGMLDGQVKAVDNGVVVMAIPAISIRMGMNETTGTFTLAHMACITDSWFISHEEVIFIHFLITPSKFFAQPFSKMTAYDDLGKEMTKCYQTMPVNSDFKPDIGDVVAAPFEEDNRYYRSVVLAKDGETVQVRFIDWGNDQVVDLQRVYRLKDVFMKLPYGAFECSLAGVEPVGDQWTSDAIGYFAMLTGQNKLNLKVVEKSADLMIVEVMVGGGSSVNDMLVQQGVAKRVGGSSPAPRSVIVEAEGDPSSVVIRRNQIRQYKVMAGLSVQAIVVHQGDPENFYVHIATDDFIANLQALDEKINEYVARENAAYLPKCQEMVIAQWQGSWYRAAVVNVLDPQQIQVHFIDYGNDDVVSVKDVRKFCSEFMTPAMAIACSLANVKPPAGRVNKEQVDLYKSLVPADGRFMLKVICTAESSASVELYEFENPDICVNKDIAKLQAASGPARRIFPANNLERRTLSLNKATAVSVASISAVDLFVNIIDPDWNSFMIFSAAIYEECLKLTAEDYQPVVGEVIAALFEAVWYRAEVRGVDSDGNVGVFFFDYGNWEVVPLSATRLLPEEMVTFPIQGIPCKLADVEPVGGKWSVDAQQVAKELFLSGEVVATSLQCLDGVHHIKLEVDKGGKIIDLGQMLVKCGHAVSTAPEPSRGNGGIPAGVVAPPANLSALQRQLQEQEEVIRMLRAKLQM
ncbi:uncharacterized protein LOC135489410 isoform X2 [Lineus longissimus]|uniref:uncharacterized protein LOC135489410 isoform X2 n=1 Tax=Lineus longissimus TaxID=88925 RepID=UPI00315C8732